MELLVWAGFRSHILLPHDVVGAIADGVPWSGLAVANGCTYYRKGEPVLRITRHGNRAPSIVVVKALRDVWLQEPGLSVKVAGEGTWRGYGPLNQWTSPVYPLEQKDAHRSTVHFPRVRTNKNYTVGVEYREGNKRLRMRSDGRFSELLARPRGSVPWQGCQVFGEDYELAGVVEDEDAILRRWELAGKPPNIGQMYFLGWVGGAGAVTNARGMTPPPGTDVTAADGYDRLWSPRSWRKLSAGKSIMQKVWLWNA